MNYQHTGNQWRTNVNEPSQQNCINIVVKQVNNGNHRASVRWGNALTRRRKRRNASTEPM